MARRSTSRNWLFIAVASALCAVGLLTLMMIGALNTGPAGLIVGMLLAALPVPFYLALALSVDRYETEPMWMLGLAFLWGASGAVFIAFILNSINSALFGAIGGQGAAAFGGSVISAPIVEETAKALALLAFFIWKKDEFDGVLDGVVYAGMVGLGFAMTENVSYYGQALASGSLVGTMVIRGVLAPFSHPLFTAMTGVGLGIARETTKRGLKLLAPIAGLCMAMFLHGTWNLSASFGGAFLGVYVVVMVPTFLALVGIVLYAQARERRIIRANLLPYVQTGHLSPAELQTLCVFGGRMKTLYAAASRGGMKEYRREMCFQQAASELAFHRWRTERGITRGTGEYVAVEAEYLQLIAASRAAVYGGFAAGA
ncbi:MAG TPA: PrsW family intramembrane metalloprotease [Longimicrobium sp.]|jgi:RsiW-degrading membrane proteinase PrsW (M82 family)|nr:PrsW family intramembrane metalloprotease [Longimicrobium sp.]